MVERKNARGFKARGSVERKQGRGSLFAGIMTVLALALLAAPAAVAVAALVGMDHRWPDILAQFTAPALFATVAFSVVLLIVKLRGAAIFGVLVSLALLAAVWPQWRPATETPDPEAPIVRLYSANLYYRNNDVLGIARSVQEADADIVMLIELGAKPSARIDTILQGYPHRVASQRLDQTRGPARSVIASRYPLTALPDPADGLHSVGAVVDSPLGALNVMGVHLTRPWPYQFLWGQITQVQALTAIHQTLNGPVIVAGDFNAVSTARIGRQIKADMDLTPASGWPGTWPIDVPSWLGLTIDQVWRSPDLAFVDRRLGLDTGSDHRPVVTEFTRKAG